MRAASATHPIDQEKARDLVRQAQGGDVTARDALVEANLRLVQSVVARFSGRGADRDDLFQVGCLGLIKAIDKFDLSFDVAFSTYAVPCIIGELRHFLRRDRPIKLGRTLEERSAAAYAAKDRLEQSLGRAPTIDEIASHIGADAETVVLALEAGARPASLDQPADPREGDISLADQIAATDATDGAVTSMAIRQVVGLLPDEERRLIQLRYLEGLSQVKTAKRLRRSQAHVSRLERCALLRLRRLWFS